MTPSLIDPPNGPCREAFGLPSSESQQTKGLNTILNLSFARVNDTGPLPEAIENLFTKNNSQSYQPFNES